MSCISVLNELSSIFCFIIFSVCVLSFDLCFPPAFSIIFFLFSTSLSFPLSFIHLPLHDNLLLSLCFVRGDSRSHAQSFTPPPLDARIQSFTSSCLRLSLSLSLFSSSMSFSFSSSLIHCFIPSVHPSLLRHPRIRRSPLQPLIFSRHHPAPVTGRGVAGTDEGEDGSVMRRGG